MHSPFEQLDPPTGGLQKLRARLDERSSRGAFWLLWMRPVPTAVTALLVILVLAVVVMKPGAPVGEAAPNWNPDAHPAWVAFGLGAPPDRSVIVRPIDQGDIALMQMLETESVVIYRVGRRVVEPLSGNAPL